MSEAGAKGGECIQVVVRCRPFNKKETAELRQSIITMDLKGNQLFIKNPDNEAAPLKPFTFDGVYDENTIQRTFYEESCFGLIENVLEGFNGTIFAYGQTGCGKTFTMQGPTGVAELKGVIPNSFSHIFEYINASRDVEFLVRCSYLEIYNEEINDLLGDQKNPLKCELKEDPQKGIFVKNLTDVIVETEAQMDAILNKGLCNRTVGSTLMNQESSRSHSIFTIIIEMNTRDKETGKELLKAGKLNLVDLAGSERQKKTGASGDRLKEGSKINLSLSALGNVISALSEGKDKHVPYRDSKLTRMLQDSLGGNTKTLMVAAISPADYNYDETLSTLRYANRAKNIKNKPKINEDPKDTMLREYKMEIERLRKLLADQADLHASLSSGLGGGSGGGGIGGGDNRSIASGGNDIDAVWATAVPTAPRISTTSRAGQDEDDEIEDDEDTTANKVSNQKSITTSRSSSIAIQTMTPRDDDNGNNNNNQSHLKIRTHHSHSPRSNTDKEGLDYGTMAPDVELLSISPRSKTDSDPPRVKFEEPSSSVPVTSRSVNNKRLSPREVLDRDHSKEGEEEGDEAEALGLTPQRLQKMNHHREKEYHNGSSNDNGTGDGEGFEDREGEGEGEDVDTTRSRLLQNESTVVNLSTCEDYEEYEDDYADASFVSRSGSVNDTPKQQQHVGGGKGNKGGNGSGEEQQQVKVVVQERIVEVERVVEREKVVVQVQKEVVEVKVEVERIPDHHLNKHKALEEYSESIIRQRNEFGDQLRQKETEAEQERKEREALNKRLAMLQSKLVGHLGSQALEDIENEEIESLKSEAERKHKERKVRAKKRKEAQAAAELEDKLRERKEVQDEIEEMKSSLESAENAQKKLLKLRKKYERKLAEGRAELDDLKEEYAAERDQFIDTIRDQDRECKLFEQICRALMTERELKKTLEKSRWNEDSDCWVLPFVKTKDVSSLLPDIYDIGSAGQKSISPDSDSGNKLHPSSLPVPSYTPRMPVQLPPTLNGQSTTNSYSNAMASSSSPRDAEGTTRNGSEKTKKRKSNGATTSSTTADPHSYSSKESFGVDHPSSSLLPPSSATVSLPTPNGIMVPSRPSKSRSKSSKKSKDRKNTLKSNDDDIGTDPDTDADSDHMQAGPLSDWGFAMQGQGGRAHPSATTGTGGMGLLPDKGVVSDSGPGVGTAGGDRGSSRQGGRRKKNNNSYLPAAVAVSGSTTTKLPSNIQEVSPRAFDSLPYL